MRRTTADADGVFEPKAVIYEAARRVADRHEKLPADWLNDGVKGLLPHGADRHAKVIGGNRLLPKAQFIVQEMFPGDPAESSPP
jgi:hypothetical protein